ncbi:MAG: hypothetical protein ABIH77_00215 [Pseudomonadota bacterium]|nr:hypothetical protein [Gammaproteobacteria bacterium]MBU1926532.1 hypothetical protein [Gammaproteobacteria bacterium]MBU2546593.1 hypothetical protein [Gammaproteobacteria bacterium]
MNGYIFHLNFYIVSSLELIALAMGSIILVLAKFHKDRGTTMLQVLGYVVIVAALINVVSSTFDALQMRSMSYLPHVRMMPQRMMNQRGPMMNQRANMNAKRNMKKEVQ